MTPEEERKIKEQARISSAKNSEGKDENRDVEKLFQNKDGRVLADLSGNTGHPPKQEEAMGTKGVNLTQDQPGAVGTSRNTAHWSGYSPSRGDTHSSESQVRQKIDENMEASMEQGDAPDNGEQGLDEEDSIRRKVDEQNERIQAERQQALSEEYEEEAGSQLTTVIASQRIMGKTGWAAAIGGGTVGIGGLAYFTSGSDSTAFIHVIRHLIA